MKEESGSMAAPRKGELSRHRHGGTDWGPECPDAGFYYEGEGVDDVVGAVGEAKSREGLESRRNIESKGFGVSGYSVESCRQRETEESDWNLHTGLDSRRFIATVEKFERSLHRKVTKD